MVYKILLVAFCFCIAFVKSRCKDCLYFRYKVGSYGICEHWHANSQDIFDLNYCGYAEPRTPKERGGEKYERI